MTSVERPLDLETAAARAGCPVEVIERLIDLGLLPPEGPLPADINGIRLMVSFESAGISLEVFAQAAKAGLLSLEFRRRLLPDPIGLSGLTFQDACHHFGVEMETATKLFVAAALPAPEPDRLTREDDVVLLRYLADGFAFGISEQSAIGVLRVFGRSVRLQAETMRDLFRSDVEAAMAREGLDPAAVMEVAAQRRLPLQQIGFGLLDVLTRRNIEDVVFENVTMRIQDALSATGLAPMRTEHDPAVVFLDLTGFAEMTAAVGDDEAAARVARFEDLAQEVVARWRGRVIKSLGDGLLTLFENADGATTACLEIMDRLADNGLPPIHAGLVVGPVVRRDGDIFGNSVNLAARLAELADPSEIVSDATTWSTMEESGRLWEDGGMVTPQDLPAIRVARLRRPGDDGETGVPTT